MPRRRRSSAATLTALTLGTVVLVVVAVLVADLRGRRPALPEPFDDVCLAQGTDGTEAAFDPDQVDHAATIAAVALRRGLPSRATTIALATALQESKLRNISYGDRDSLGLFQQRPSQGWGTPAQVQDPVYASGAFFDRLVRVSSWQRRPLTEVAQAVQRSGYPEAYARWELPAQSLGDALSGERPAALGCHLHSVDPAPSPSPGSGPTPRTSATLQRLTDELWVDAVVDPTGRGLSVAVDALNHPWAVASWAVARASELGVMSVELDGRRWNRGSARWQATPSASPASPSSGPGRLTITMG